MIFIPAAMSNIRFAAWNKSVIINRWLTSISILLLYNCCPISPELHMNRPHHYECPNCRETVTQQVPAQDINELIQFIRCELNDYEPTYDNGNRMTCHTCGYVFTQ